MHKMFSFCDEAFITVCSGKGGNGCISFRREKFIPLGGPSGGDGGKGGDVLFCVKQNMRTLSTLRYKKTFKAQNGTDGAGRQRYGKDGSPLVIYVPPGTSIFNAKTGELLKDFGICAGATETKEFLCLKGGKGGWGNMHFKSSVNQAPRYAHSGKPGETLDLRIELSIMADVGLVGFPNAGKSSLLNAFTNARPKIAPYPFTTKIPNLGVLTLNAQNENACDIVIADIPGIIEGAAGGAGLGLRFLKHISRTQCLVFMIDCSDKNFFSAFDTLKKEIQDFNKDLLKKPFIVLCNKIDIEGAFDNAKLLIQALKQKDPNITAIPISVLQNYGLKDATKKIAQLTRKNQSFMDCDIDDSNGNSDSGGNKEGKKQTRASIFLQGRSVDGTCKTQFPGEEGVAL